MCQVCGCGAGEVRIDGRAAHDHGHPGGHHHDHHDGHHHHDHGVHGHGHDHAGLTGEGRLVRIEEQILSRNQRFADANRARLEADGILACNLISSPGAGKTSLLVATLKALAPELALAVIEGDQETSNDADRIRATGVPAVQINTGRGCHLDAHMVGHALDELGLERGGVLFIENVGNLVCPAGFDLGESATIALLSVTEGDDKPIKYPDAFAAADLMLLTKTDLAPHVDFDAGVAIGHARAVNPSIGVLRLSARTGEGMGEWLDWIRQRRLQRAMRDVAAGAAHSVPGR